MPGARRDCAAYVLDSVPLVMRVIRHEIRRCVLPEFSVPQFRAMGFIGRNRGAALSEVAEHVGLTLPAASRMVDGLVAAGLADRTLDLKNRRRMRLTLTAKGRSRHRAARESAQKFLAKELRKLTVAQRASVAEAMRLLHSVFAPADSRIRSTNGAAPSR